MSASESASASGKELGQRVARSKLGQLAVLFIIVAGGAWWYFGGATDDTAPAVDAKPQAATPRLSERELYDLMMVNPDRARSIREVKSHKELVSVMRDIEKATAGALRYADANELKIQSRYVDIVVARVGQIPDPQHKATDCMTAAFALDDYLREVLRSYSPARAEAALTTISERWRKSMASCERSVGLKASSRLL
jgi:hypothetical protein